MLLALKNLGIGMKKTKMGHVVLDASHFQGGHFPERCPPRLGAVLRKSSRDNSNNDVRNAAPTTSAKTNATRFCVLTSEVWYERFMCEES